MPRDTFENQINALKRQVLTLGARVGGTIGEGVEALRTKDRVLAEAIVRNDEEINRKRYQIEEGCYTLIATQQPLAGDLRDIISILLIAIELERIADHSKNLAEIVFRMGDEPLLKRMGDIPRMAELVQSMLAQALDAFARGDAQAARGVILMDDQIDGLYVQVFRVMMTYVAEDPRTVARVLHLLFAAHNLERAADRVTNIGERVIYAATGHLQDLNIERPLSDQVDVNRRA